MHKQKWLSIVMILSMLLTLIYPYGPISAQVGVELKVGSLSGSPGETIEIPIILTSQGQVGGFSFDLQYNTQYLTYLKQANVNPDIQGVHTVSFNEEASSLGNISGISYNMSAIPLPSDTVEIATLVFEVKEGLTPGSTSTIMLSNTDVSDTSGNSIGDTIYTNGVFTVADTVAPILQGITVFNDMIELTYNELLDEDSIPSNSSFSVVVNQNNQSPNQVIISGNKVNLTLTSGVEEGDLVIISYNVPSTNPLRDLFGNDASSLTSVDAINNTPDQTNPVLAVLLPTNNSYTVSSEVTITGEVTDRHPDKVFITLNNDQPIEVSISGDGSFNYILTLPSEGQHIVKAKARDIAGNESEETIINVFYDTTKPVVTLLTPENVFTPDNTYTIQFNVSEENIEEIEVSANGQIIGSTANDENYEAVIPLDTSSDPSDTIVTITATDKAGNQSDPVIATITYSTQVVPLTVTLPELNSNSFTNTPALTISGATIPEASLSVELTDPIGQKSSPAISVGTDGLLTGTINLSAEGQYTLTVIAAQTGQYTGDGESTITFTYDNTNPSVTFSGVENGEIYSENKTPIIQVSDNNLDNEVATLSINNGSPTPFTSGTTLSDDGNYILQVTATDKAGNQSSQTVNFTIDKTAPEISITGVDNGTTYNAPIAPTIDVTDNLSEPEVTVTLSKDEGVPSAYTSGTPIDVNGYYLLKVEAEDDAGNQSTIELKFVLLQGDILEKFEQMLNGDGSNMPGLKSLTNAKYQQILDDLIALNNAAWSSESFLTPSQMDTLAQRDITQEKIRAVLMVLKSKNLDSLRTSGSQNLNSFKVLGLVFDIRKELPQLERHLRSRFSGETLMNVFNGLMDIKFSSINELTPDGSARNQIINVLRNIGGMITEEQQAWSNMGLNFTTMKKIVEIAKNNGYEESFNNFFAALGFIEKDLIAPVISQTTTPADGAVLNTNTPTISARVTDNNEGSGIDTSSIELILDNVKVNPTYTASTGTISYTPTTTLLIDGLHTVSLSVADLEGNEATLTWSFTVDTQAQLNYVYHTAFGQLRVGSKYKIVAIGEPSAQSVVAKRNQTLINLLPVSGKPGVYESAEITVSANEDFKGTFKVVLTDRVGNISAEKETQIITIDTTAPSINNATVNQVQFKEGDELEVTFTSNENDLFASFDIGSIIKNISLTFNNELNKYIGRLLIDNLDFIDETITIKAQDKFGNEATHSLSQTVSADSIAPEVQLSVTGTRGIAGYYKQNPVTVRLQTEAGATIQYEVKTGDALVDQGSYTASAGALYKDIILEGDNKNYTLTYYAVDPVGNESIHFTKDFKVDTVAPTNPTIKLVAGNPLPSTTKSGQIGVKGISEGSTIQLSLNGKPRGQKPSDSEFNLVLNRGVNSIIAKAVDQAGNESQPITANITFDDLPPIFTITPDLTNGTITAITSENLNDQLVDLSIVLDGGAPITDQTNTKEEINVLEGNKVVTLYKYAYDLDADLTFTSTLLIQVSATDSAGNTGTSEYHEEIVSTETATRLERDNAQLEIDAGDLPESGTISMRSEDPTNVPDGNEPAGPAYSMEYSSNQQFNDEIVGTFYYPVPDGWDATEYMATLSFKTWSGEEWLPLGTSADDNNPNGWYTLEVAEREGKQFIKVIMNFKHFSTYGGFVDTTPPVLTVNGDGATYNASDDPIVISGTSEVGATVQVKLNGSNTISGSQVVGSNGQFSIAINLDNFNEGTNNVTIEAIDRANNKSIDSITLHVDTILPNLIVTAPNNNLYSKAPAITFTGISEPGAEIIITRGSTELSRSLTAVDGSFSKTISLQEGSNSFSVIAEDDAGNRTAVNRTINRDTVLPVITLTNTSDLVSDSTINVLGSVNEAFDSLTVTVNGQNHADVTLNNQSFIVNNIALEAGENTITFTATDRAGNIGSKVYVVSYEPEAPTISVTNDIPALTDTNSIIIEGTSKIGTTITVLLNGTEVDTLEGLTTESFTTQSITLVEGDNSIVLVAVKNGITAITTVNVELDTQAPTLELEHGSIVSDKVSITGTANEILTEVTVNGQDYSDRISGDQKSFTVTDLSVPNYSNVFMVMVKDRLGHTTTESITVTNTSKGGSSEPPIGGGGFVPIGGSITGKATPAKGGSVSFEDGKLIVALPAQAVNKEIEITVDTAELTDTQKAALSKVIGKAVNVTAKTTDSNENVSKFNKEFKITFKFTNADLGGTNTDKLQIAYWNEKLKLWVPLPTKVINDEATATVGHMTTFALIVAKDGTPQISVDSGVETNATTISGIANPNATVHALVNGKMAIETVTDSSGKFKLNAGPLQAGINTVFVHDARNNTVSTEYVITYSPAPLTDLNNHWAKANINALVDLGILTGYPNGEFKPEKSVTRAEFMSMLARALGLTIYTEADVNHFADADDLSWAKAYVAAAYETGLVTGYTENGLTYFKPDKTISRAEIAVFISRAISYKKLAAPTGDGVTFTDAERLPAWAKAEIDLAAQYGIITGYQDGSFQANGKATRAETATMIKRLLDLE